MTAPPPPDPAALERLERIGGATLVVRILAIYLRDAPLRLGEAREALVARDRVGLAAAAHGLISTAANVGAMELSETVRALERAARTAPWEELETGVAAMARAIDEVTPALTAEWQRRDG